MDASALLTLTQTLLQLIESPVVKEIESVWSFKIQLGKLKNTMSTICAVLEDAAELERQQLGITKHTDRDWIAKLRDVLYQAEDLFGEVAYVAQLKELMSGNKVTKEVQLFFSRFNPLAFALSMSREIKKIRECLDDIAKDRRDFGSGRHGSAELGMSRRSRITEMRSLVHVNDVIGRDGDKKVVIDMLLDSNNTVLEDVRFVTIVGIGGLGKTALAKLVYNDDSIQTEFPLKLWVCVSEEFDLRGILCQLLGSATNQGQLGMHELERKFRENIEGKKYLLVLDDVWNEDRNKWLQLKGLLIRGARGSRVVVTARSRAVAGIVGGSSVHELQGLSPQDSWSLFKRMAFENEQEGMDDELIAMGEHIVKKCCNVPLAIRVVGSLLFGQSKSTWQSFRDMDLASIQEGKNNDIIPILKLSYYNLEPKLRRCFSFCAVFPKDHVIDKVMLINLWMAHGFIQPLQDQSFEDAGEECFLTLVQRCFFQEIELDFISDDIKSCKLHDLMHDVAQEVARTEILVINSNKIPPNENIRHISFDDSSVAARILANKMKRMRTLTLLDLRTLTKWDLESYERRQLRLRDLSLSKARYLRVLCLKYLRIRSLPSAIDELIHLRFLDLSGNLELEFLPASLAKLINLQTLSLSECGKLKELPRDFSKLVNLRHLDLDKCDGLSHMPTGMNNMTCLEMLTMFVVGGTNHDSSSKQARAGQLEDLAALTNLKGKLEIRHWKFEATRGQEAEWVLKEKKHLKDIHIAWENEAILYRLDDDGVALLEGLYPHPNVRAFCFEGYPGERFGSWASLQNFATSLPNLVKLEINRCSRLRQLPSLSQLRHLKVLSIQSLDNLEYIEVSSRENVHGDGFVASSCTSSSGSEYDQVSHFPSLEKLYLYGLPKLKGWRGSSSSSSSGVWVGVDEQVVDIHASCAPQQQQLLFLPSYSAFPRLSQLTIWDCPNLTSIPLPPSLEYLYLHHSLTLSDSLTAPPATPSSSSSSSQFHTWKLKRLTIDKVGVLKYLPVECLQSLSDLSINYYDEMRLSMGEEVFRSCLSSSLKHLTLHFCINLKSLCGGGLENLTALKLLILFDLHELEEVEDGNHMPWKSLHRNLRHLQFTFLNKMVNLPQGIQYLTSLQSLDLIKCPRLQGLPEGMSCLTSLQSLFIYDCPLLKERCAQLTGEDWPKIQHIPTVKQTYFETNQKQRKN